MRRNIAISAILIFFMSAFAQNPVFNNPDNRPYWGIRGSFDISIPGDMETNGYKELGLPVNLYTSAGGHKRFNFLWGVGAGLDINRFHISIIGYFGLVNMMHSPTTFHENVARVAFGYNF